MIKWIPYEDLVITPKMENRGLLLYVNQKKACALKVPRVITADIIDGKVKICYSHHLYDKDFDLSTITHYIWLNHPWSEE